MKILGVSSYHHDSAAASLRDGEILGASHEERFSRVKNDKRFPERTGYVMLTMIGILLLFMKKKPILNSNLKFASGLVLNLY